MKALAIPFRLANGAIATTQNYDDIVRWQVLDAAATNLNERVMRPEYGVNARDYLFRPGNDMEHSDVAGVITQKITSDVPRATIAGVSVTDSDIQQNLVEIEIHYKTSRIVGATTNTVSLTTTTGTA